MTVEDLKTKYSEKYNQIDFSGIQNDNIYKFLEKDHTSKAVYSDKIRLKVLPYNILDNSLKTADELWKSSDYKQYDPIYTEWENHIKGYWEDKLDLLEKYTNPVMNAHISPFEVSLYINGLLTKIEKRVLIINFVFSTYEQIQQRVGSEPVVYKFIRTYWINKHGDKVRMITKHLGNKFDEKISEIGKMFSNRDFIVSQNVRLFKDDDQIKTYDLVIEREKARYVVDIKLEENDFNYLLILNELLLKFKEDYK